MIDRILAILKQKNLTPAQFADLINVQRSSISHLISGRNKPSLEFIQKIINTFPEVDTDWLIFGKGTMIQDEKTAVTPAERKLNSLSPELLFGDEIIKEKRPEVKKPELEKIPELKLPEIEKGAKKKTPENETRKIERILFFYKDNTFREYFPE